MTFLNNKSCLLEFLSLDFIGTEEINDEKFNFNIIYCTIFSSFKLNNHPTAHPLIFVLYHYFIMLRKKFCFSFQTFLLNYGLSRWLFWIVCLNFTQIFFLFFLETLDYPFKILNTDFSTFLAAVSLYCRHCIIHLNAITIATHKFNNIIWADPGSIAIS